MERGMGWKGVWDGKGFGIGFETQRDLRVHVDAHVVHQSLICTLSHEKLTGKCARLTFVPVKADTLRLLRVSCVPVAGLAACSALHLRAALPHLHPPLYAAALLVVRRTGVLLRQCRRSSRRLSE